MFPTLFFLLMMQRDDAQISSGTLRMLRGKHYTVNLFFPPLFDTSLLRLLPSLPLLWVAETKRSL